MQNHDMVAAGKIKSWLETRASNRPAWKKVSSLAATFRVRRLTASAKKRIVEALAIAGIDLDPAIENLGLTDTVLFHLVESENWLANDSLPEELTSEDLPNQITTWDASNFGEPDGYGQWLPCLKTTLRGDRQFIWEGSSGRGIVGIVTYSGEIRNAGGWKGWGVYEEFQDCLTHQHLLGNASTRNRFDNRGIKALQGLPIRLREAESEAIVDLLGGLDQTAFPLDQPDFSEPFGDWQTPRQFPIEKLTEDAIVANDYLWKAIGLGTRPQQQVKLPPVGRIDLLSGNTIVEVKKSVNVAIGPGQIERYLRYLSKKLRVGPEGVRGILVQKNAWLAPGVQQRLEQSEFPVELWSVDQGINRRWIACRLL